MQEGAVIVSDDSSQRVQKNWDCHTIDGDDHFELCRPDSKKHIGYKKLVESIQNCVQSEPKFKEPIDTDEDPTYPIGTMEGLDRLLSSNLYQVLDFHLVNRSLSDDELESLRNPRILTPASIEKGQYLAICNSEDEHSASTGKFQHFVAKCSYPCHILRRLQPIHDDVRRFVQKINIHHLAPVITLFRSITVFCETDSFPRNIS